VKRASGTFESLTREVQEEEAKMFPTPRSSEVAAGMTIENVQNRLEKSGYHSNLEELVAIEAPEAVEGALSADWVEWLMNVPAGWTRLEPLPEGALEDWLQMTLDGTWFAEERGLPRVVKGQEKRASRLKALGNGIVPASGALAISLLLGE
jgi:hypothetical protein